MKIISFKYTKSDGKVSNRVLAVSASPTKLYSGTDISSLSVEEQAEYAVMVDSVKSTYLNALTVINNNFDLNYNYRQFSPEKMTEVVEEEI